MEMEAAAAEEVGNCREVERISPPADRAPGNILCSRFLLGASEEENEDGEGMELSLGLSMNGRFGVDPAAKRKLTRSSSISDIFVSGGASAHMQLTPPLRMAALMKRSISLPTTEAEEWRKQKDLPSLRRREAKRKRTEKQRSVTAGAASWRVEKHPPPASQASMESQGSGLSWVSSDSRPIQGFNKSTVSVQLEPKHRGRKMALGPETGGGKREESAAEMARSVLVDMPCVSTTGDGPNGKRIDGFLYGYRKGEEVRIMCVCHGSFLSPAEFVKHAGGGDLVHPHRHIVVNTASFV